MRHALYLALPLVLIACPMADPGNGDGGGVDAGNTPAGDAGNNPRPDAGTPGQAHTIQEIRGGAVEAEAQVLIENAVVTAIQPGRGLWIQQGSGPDSGIYLFGSEAADTEGLVVGKAVDLQGVYTVFNDLKQIKFPTLTAMRDGQTTSSRATARRTPTGSSPSHSSRPTIRRKPSPSWSDASTS